MSARHSKYFVEYKKKFWGQFLNEKKGFHLPL
jgi:hypothetical protein